MAYYLDGQAGLQVDIPALQFTNNNSNVNWDIELQGNNTGEEMILLGDTGTLNFLILRSDNTIDFRINNETTTVAVTDITDFSAVYRFEARWSGGDRVLSFYENGSFVRSSVVSQIGTPPFVYFFRAGTTTRQGNLAYLKYTDYENAANNRNYVNTTGTGNLFPDAANSNDGTLIGFPADGSQWVPYDDGAGGTPFSEALTPKADASANLSLLSALGQSQSLGGKTDASALQAQTLNAGSAQVAASIQDSVTTLTLGSVVGIRSTASPALGTAQTQLLELVSGLTVAIVSATDNSALQTLNLVSGVSDSLIVALSPEQDASSIQQFGERLGQIYTAAPEQDSGTTVNLNLIAGSSIPYSDTLAPNVGSSTLQAFTVALGHSSDIDPETSIQGSVTLDDRTGQIIEFAPVTDSSGLQIMGLFTGVVIGSFKTSSVVDISHRYSAKAVSPNYSVRIV